MLITQKMANVHLSENEKVICKYLEEHKEEWENLTVKELSGRIYVSPASLIVFAKKLGFSGWNEFRISFFKEQAYHEAHFSGIDANVPFTRKDSIMKIANKIAVLQRETIDDTMSLVDHNSLRKALEILKNSDMLYLYGVSMSYMAAQEFAYSMKRLGKPTEYCLFQTEQLFQIKAVERESCAMVISYTGETPHVIKICDALKKKKIPVIAVTGIGENSLKKYSDVCLNLSTRENVHSKISTFTTRQSIHTILDIIYSCYFAMDYEKNYRSVMEANKEIEKDRFSTNSEINR